MSRKTTEVFVCDRCGFSCEPRARRTAEDDDGFPSAWARATFRDSQVNWERDLCRDCANEVGRAIRVKVPQ